MKDVLGQAISDYHHRQLKGKLWVNNKYGPKEEMPVEVYFREADEMPELEWIALQKCRGRILDIGAGAGSHALLLQKMGNDITALEISPLSAETMRRRGVEKILQQDFFDFDEASIDGSQTKETETKETRTKELPNKEPGFDTLLLLMNGIGLAATLAGLRRFLQQAGKLLRPGGQLLFDSSDIAYLYKGKKRAAENYYGEIQYQYEYNRQQSDWFNWLFIDKATLRKTALSEGWITEILFEDGCDQYLAKCQLKRMVAR